MNHQKGFVSVAVLIGLFVVIALGGAGYVAMNPEVFEMQTETQTEVVMQKDDGVQTEPGDHPEEERGADEGMTVQTVTDVSAASITWRFVDVGEIDGMPHTKATVIINGTAYEAGTFLGSCSEIGATGGVDGKGLLTGEISAAQCWFAGGGKEIGVFGHEDGGVEVMVGELSEGEEGTGLFRGDFSIINTIRF